MHAYHRRDWLVSAAAALAAAPLTASASPPETEANPRIAAVLLPIVARSIRLPTTSLTPLVVTAIAADPRGQLLAAAGDDHRIHIFRAATLSHVQSLDGHRDRVRSLAFDSSGNRLASTGNDGQLITWDREASFQLQQRRTEAPALARLCWSPQGDSIAAVGFNHRVYLFGSHGKIPRLQCDCRDLRAVAFRSDGQVLAVAGRSGDLHLFDLQSGQLASEIPLHRGRIQDLVFDTQTARVICVSDDGDATVLDSHTGHLIHRIPVTTSKLFAVAVIGDQLAATAGSDNEIRILNTERGEVVRTLPGHYGSVSALSAAGDWLFSGSYDTTLRRWPIAAIAGSGQRIAEGDPRLDR